MIVGPRWSSMMRLGKSWEIKAVFCGFQYFLVRLVRKCQTDRRALVLSFFGGKKEPRGMWAEKACIMVRREL